MPVSQPLAPVLVVAESVSTRHLLAQALAFLRVPALTAGGAENAAGLLRAQPGEFGLALFVGGQKGLEVLRSAAPSLGCCVLASDPAAAEDALAAGADAVLREPFSLAELLACVRAVSNRPVPSTLVAWPRQLGRLAVGEP